MRFHLLGVGGAGMNVIAQLLHAEGHDVSGSDKQNSAVLERLKQSGVKVFVGHDEKNVPEDCIVVYSSAINSSNPELSIAKRRKQEIWHRSKALAFVGRDKKFVSVAGTHGKTTTSGMLSFALTKMNLKPSYAVGSEIKGLNLACKFDEGDIFVAEADESDKSFLNYSSEVAIVTNIEADHLDNYKDLFELRSVFEDFANNIVPDGTLVTCSDDDGGKFLAEKMFSHRRVITYGYKKCTNPNISTSVQIVDEKFTTNSASATFVLTENGEKYNYDVDLDVTGRHNLLNACAVFCAGIHFGVDLSELLKALSLFQGTGRRFEFRGCYKSVKIFDDYAHHPTEVKAAIDQARIVAGAGKVYVIFQPHLYSRTMFFAKDFAKSLSLADCAVVVDIYAAREDPVEGVDSSIITKYMDSNKGVFIPDKNEAAYYVASHVCAGDIIVTIGAGDITFLCDNIYKFLQGELF